MHTLIYGMWGLVPCPGIEPGPPALGEQTLSHWSISEVSVLIDFYSHLTGLCFMSP